MATYVEIATFNNDIVKQRVRTATMIAAQKIIAALGTATQGQKDWAKSVLSNLDYEAGRMLLAVLAANIAVPLADIIAADDVTVQAAVDAAVPLFSA